jgi:DNA mismatch repair protein MutS
MDEVGRGTATNDGLAIAWAVLEHLHFEVKARTLFATHYHELTELSQALQGMMCFYIHVEEQADDIVLTHKLVPGVAKRSFGIAVARMAGVPASVISRAQELLKRLES